MLSQSKFSKYLLYAIGEITLVVIGILIALQINNWNEQQKNLAKEQLILKQLKNEYISNLKQLDEKILMRNQGIEAAQQLLNQIDNTETIDEEQFYESYWQLMRDPTFDPILNDIVGSEKLRLIRNQELVRILSNWSSEVYQVQELELEYKKFRTELIIPNTIRLGISRNINNSLWKDGYTPTEALDKKFNYQFTIGASQKDIDLTKVLNDSELEGIVSQALTFYQVTNIQSYTLRERIMSFLEIIEQDIEK